MRPIDIYVGQRVKARRCELGLSVKAVADMLGVHYQQVQRYESGAVRASAARLWGFAKALGVRIDYFFDGYEEGSETTGIDVTDISSDSARIESDAKSLQLRRSFATLQEHEKNAIFSLVRSMAEKDAS